MGMNEIRKLLMLFLALEGFLALSYRCGILSVAQGCYDPSPPDGTLLVACSSVQVMAQLVLLHL
jgi:hypothetical protein